MNAGDLGGYGLLRHSAAAVAIRPTLVRATGADRAEYLHRRLTQHIHSLLPGMGRRACLLGGDGRMLADFEIFALDGEYLLLAAPALDGAALAAQLARYTLAKDAEFAEVTSESELLVLRGPLAEEALRDLGATPPARAEVVETRVAGFAATIMRSEIFCDAFIVLQREGMRGALASEFAAASAAAFHALRIETGVPWWGAELDERTIPLEAGLHAAIDRDKGCFPGQEVLARISNLGHPARQLVGVVAEDGSGLKEPGVRLYDATDGSDAGVATSVCASPVNGRDAGLAMVRWSSRDIGTQLRAGDETVRVVELPMA